MKWLLVAFFCFSTTSALVGSNRCTWGPSYWCRDLQSAKKCNAVPHCMRMWKAQPSSSVSSTETCLVCKVMVQGLKTMIANKKTQEEIKELAEKVCDLMKNEKIAYEVCNTVVYLYLPEVFKMIDSEIDADTICKLLHLCDSSKLKNKVTRLAELLAKAKSVNLYEHCNECQLTVVMVKSYLNDKHVQKGLIQLVDNEVCPKLSKDLKIFCTAFAETEMPKLFKFLEKLLDPEAVCAFLRLCPRTSHESFVPNLVAKLVKNQFRVSGVECQLCQTGISGIRNMLRDASFQKQIETFLKMEVCTHLGSLATSCLKDVALYFPVAIKFVINELDPVESCKLLGLCATSSLPLMNRSPAKVTRVSEPRAFPLCAICEFVMNKLESMIGTNRTEAAITAALKEVCTIMPQSIRSECDNFVNKYAPEVIKLLVEKVAPTLVCTALGLCFGRAEVNTQLLFQRLQGRGDLL